MPDSSGAPPDSTLALVERVKAGDRAAFAELFERSLPALKRWTAGRLPAWTRDRTDSDALVQETVTSAIGRIGKFDARHSGALQAYLRQAVAARIRDEIRRHSHGRQETPPHDDRLGSSGSPLEAAIGREAVERYERALARLLPEEREAIIVKMEMDYTYEEAAAALGQPSADAARMAVSLALVSLAREMSRVG